MDEIAAIAADMYDEENTEYTFDNMITEIRVNSENFVNMIRNIITDRKSLITKDTAQAVKDELFTSIVQKIVEIQREIKI